MKGQLSNLLRTFFLVEIRDKNNAGLKKFAGTLAIYLFVNSMLSFGYYRAFNEKSYVILSFSSILFLLSFIVLTDMGNLFFSGRHRELLRSLPLRNEDLMLSRIISSFTFLSILITAALVPQVIFFYKYSESIFRCISFAAAEFLFAYLIIGLEIIMYSVAVKFLKSRATLLINLMQVLFFVFIFYSTSLSSGKSGVKSLLTREDISQSQFVKYIPQTLYAGALDDNLRFALCFAITAAVFAFLFIFLKKNQDDIADSFAAISVKPEKTTKISILNRYSSALEKLLLKDNVETAGFKLAQNQIGNSKFLKMKFFPVFLMPVVVVITGVAMNISSLIIFDGSKNFITTSIIMISPTVTFTLIMCSRLLMSNTKILDPASSETMWIYETLPVENTKKILTGTAKYIHAYFVLPAVVIVIVLLTFKIDFTAVFTNLLFISSGIYFINSVNLLFDKTLPFTLESSKFNSISKVTEILFSILLGMLLFFIQIFVFQNIIFVLISIVILIAAAILINRN